MDEPKNIPLNPPPAGNAPAPDDLVYNVMPSAGNTLSPVSGGPKGGMIPLMPRPTGSGSGSRKWVYIITGTVLILALAALAYYLLGPSNKKTATVDQTVSKLPKVWLQQYFNSDLCSDQATCGDNADPDNDGLNNYAEFKAGTNPLNPDTDSDGLADGDEVNIYKTDPTLKYTDRREIVAANDWSDGFQVKNGYDPITGVKFTDVRVKQIQADTATFHLHEPSITTTTGLVTPTNTQTNPPATAAAQTLHVTILSSTFAPGSLVVKKGATVVWTNKDPMAHTVTSDTSVFNSPNLSTNQSFTYTFTNTGTFAYHCSIHSTMKGTVVVQ